MSARQSFCGKVILYDAIEVKRADHGGKGHIRKKAGEKTNGLVRR